MRIRASHSASDIISLRSVYHIVRGVIFQLHSFSHFVISFITVCYVFVLLSFIYCISISYKAKPPVIRQTVIVLYNKCVTGRPPIHAPRFRFYPPQPGMSWHSSDLPLRSASKSALLCLRCLNKCAQFFLHTYTLLVNIVIYIP